MTGEKLIEKGIYLRGDYQYRTRIMIGGQRITSTFETLEEARAFLNLKRAQAALDPEASSIAASRIKRKDASAWSIARLLDLYEAEVTPRKRGAATERTRIRKIKRFRIAKISAYRVNRDDVLNFLDDLQEDMHEQGRSISSTTLRKYTSLFSSLFNVAIKRWGMDVKNPIEKIELPKPRKPRNRRLDNELERDYFFRALSHARQKQMLSFAQLAMATGMRRGELMTLRWDHIKIDDAGDHGSAYLPLTKNTEPRVVPLTESSCAILRSLPKQQSDPRVFQLRPHHIRSAWVSALARAKKNYLADCHATGAKPSADFLADLRLHDLRHECTSSLFELGLDRVEVASVTGHKTLQMLKDYTHLRAHKLARKINDAQKNQPQKESGA